MGCECRVLVCDGPSGAAAAARRRVDELEARWSRFRTDSEISRLNAADGALCVVSQDTFLLLQRSVEAWALTDGAFDPTVLPALVAMGYDRTFERIWSPGPAGGLASMNTERPAPGCSGIELFEETRAVLVPPGVHIDPGGIGKGLAGDLVATEAMAMGAAGVAVDVGGDVRVIGESDRPRSADSEWLNPPWVIDVLDPTDSDGVIASVELDDGAVATSSRAKRSWKRGTESVHHLVDPSTGSPIDNDLVAVTVVASQGWWAEALTKQVYVHGIAGLRSDLRGARAFAIDVDGGYHDSAMAEAAS